MNFTDNDLLMCSQVKIPDVLLPADVLLPPRPAVPPSFTNPPLSSLDSQTASCRPTCIYAGVFAFVPELLVSDR